MQSRFYHVLYSERLGGAALVAIKIAERLELEGRLGAVLVNGNGPALKDLQGRRLPTRYYLRDEVMSPRRTRAVLGNMHLGLKLASWNRNIVHFHLPALYRASRFALGRCRSVVHVQIEESRAMYEWAFKAPPHLIVPCARFM